MIKKFTLCEPKYSAYKFEKDYETKTLALRSAITKVGKPVAKRNLNK